MEEEGFFAFGLDAEKRQIDGVVSNPGQCLVAGIIDDEKAPLHMLAVDPLLPEWAPDLTLRGLRVGEARADLRFWRDGKGKSQGRRQYSTAVSARCALWPPAPP